MSHKSKNRKDTDYVETTSPIDVRDYIIHEAEEEKNTSKRKADE